MPRVSVVIPAFNQAQFLKEAIDSVLCQSFSDLEVIVVDDGSTDDTSLVAHSIRDSRVRYIHQENQGLSAARNTGIEAAHGEYVALLDSDDVLCDGGLGSRVAALDACPDLGLTAGGYLYVDEHGRPLRQQEPWRNRPNPDLESVLWGGLAPPSAVMLRRHWLVRLGGFDSRFRMAEDMDLWFRLGLSGCRMGWTRGVVCQYRIHQHNMSRSIAEHGDAYLAVLDRLFARPDLPLSVGNCKAEILASKRLAQAGRLYGAGDSVAGKQALELALRLHPALLTEDQRSLISQMVAWEDCIWVDDAETVLNRALANLPEELVDLPGFTSRIERTRYAARFYRAHSKGERQKVRRLWMTLARDDVAWLLNRGNWSILFRSLG